MSYRGVITVVPTDYKVEFYKGNSKEPFATIGNYGVGMHFAGILEKLGHTIEVDDPEDQDYDDP